MTRLAIPFLFGIAVGCAVGVAVEAAAAAAINRLGQAVTNNPHTTAARQLGDENQ